MTGKAFTKGERATLIGSWDNRGTFSFRQVIVHSCGKKQMVLTDIDSREEIGRHFVPAVGNVETLSCFNWGATFKRLNDVDAEALCLQLGAALPAVCAAENERRAAWNESQGRVCLLPINLDEMHEPRAINRTGWR